MLCQGCQISSRRPLPTPSPLTFAHHLQLLPDVLLLRVLAQLEDGRSLLAVGSCGSSRLRRLATAEPLLWRRLCCLEWGLPAGLPIGARGITPLMPHTNPAIDAPVSKWT